MHYHIIQSLGGLASRIEYNLGSFNSFGPPEIKQVGILISRVFSTFKHNRGRPISPHELAQGAGNSSRHFVIWLLNVERGPKYGFRAETTLGKIVIWVCIYI